MASGRRGSGATEAGLVESRSSYPDTISSKAILARLAVDGIALAFLLTVLWIWLVARRKNPNLKRLLPWNTFGLLLVVASMGISLDVLDIVLANCFVIGLVDYSRVNVAVSVLSEISNLLALGVILLPLTLHILHRAGQKTRVVTFINGSVLVAVALMMIPFLVVNSMSSLGNAPYGRSFPAVANKVGATYYLLHLLASTVGSLILSSALFKAAGETAITTSIKVWTLFTISTLLLGNLAVVIEMFGWTLASKTFSIPEWIASVALFQFFFVLSIFGTLQTASCAAMPSIDPTTNATYDPDAHASLQPGMHKRFTYIGGSAESHPSPQLYETQWVPTSMRAHTNDVNQPIFPHAL